jgi:hypothetical protein
MYVGNGYIIDAPRAGLDVQKIPMNTDWYAQNFEGAVRPQVRRMRGGHRYGWSRSGSALCAIRGVDGIQLTAKTMSR